MNQRQHLVFILCLASSLLWTRQSFAAAEAPLAECLAQLNVGPCSALCCEHFAAKDYDHELLIERGDKLELDLDWQALAAGKSLLSYNSFKAGAFQAAFAAVPTLSRSELFKEGLVTALVGAFIADDKSEEFFSPDFQLKATTLESIGRKLTVHGVARHHHVAATKLVKHSIPFCADLKLHMDLASHVYHPHTNSWSGDPHFRLNAEENAFLDAAVRTGNDLGLILDHRTVVYARGHDCLLRGSYFITSNFKIPDTGKSLVVTWQFVGINVNWLVKSIASFLPRLTRHTVMRDYARFVDAVRGVGSSKTRMDCST